MAEKRLVDFIRESKKRGYEDWQIREPLIKKGWPEHEINKAFLIVHQSNKPKTKVCVYLDYGVKTILEKRAKKNLLSLPDQIEDILRRSCINQMKPSPDKVNDTLLSIFSKRKYQKHN